MMDSVFGPPMTRQTAGSWTHRGRMVISIRRDDGTLLSVTLPDDLYALLARVAALEEMVTRPPVA